MVCSSLTQCATGLYGWVHHRVFGRRSSEAFIRCIPIAPFIVAHSVFLVILCARAAATSLPHAALLLIWASYGAVPATGAFHCGEQMDMTFAFWAFVVGCVQCAQWTFSFWWKAYKFYRLSDEDKQLLFDTTILNVIGERVQFFLGLIWDPVGGWILIAIPIVLIMAWLFYTCEMYRSFFLITQEGESGWDVGGAALRQRPPPQQAQAAAREPLLQAQTAATKAQNAADAARKQQQQVMDYQENLYQYYVQFGELGARAAPTGLPVEQYLQTLPPDQRSKWEEYLNDLLAEQERERTVTGDTEERTVTGDTLGSISEVGEAKDMQLEEQC